MLALCVDIQVSQSGSIIRLSYETITTHVFYDFYGVTHG